MYVAEPHYKVIRSVGISGNHFMKLFKLKFKFQIKGTICYCCSVLPTTLAELIFIVFYFDSQLTVHESPNLDQKSSCL